MRRDFLKKEDIDGLELRWDDPKLIETLLKKAARREGESASFLPWDLRELLKPLELSI